LPESVHTQYLSTGTANSHAHCLPTASPVRCGTCFGRLTPADCPTWPSRRPASTSSSCRRHREGRRVVPLREGVWAGSCRMAPSEGWPRRGAFGGTAWACSCCMARGSSCCCACWALLSCRKLCAAHAHCGWGLYDHGYQHDGPQHRAGGVLGSPALLLLRWAGCCCSCCCCCLGCCGQDTQHTTGVGVAMCVAEGAPASAQACGLRQKLRACPPRTSPNSYMMLWFLQQQPVA
jgi:hypothetical protein